MVARCGLCHEDRKLRRSHIVPDFVGRWLKDTSATGYLRYSGSPNKRHEVTERLYLLCEACEQRLETKQVSAPGIPALAAEEVAIDRAQHQPLHTECERVARAHVEPDDACYRVCIDRLEPVSAGNAKDRYGNPLTIKLTGKVEPYFLDKPTK